MKIPIQRLIDDEKIPNDHAEGIEEFYLKIIINVDYIK